MEQKIDQNKRYPEMLFWGMGRIADAVVLNFVSMFLLYYYNQVLGLNPLLAGVALALAMAVDAISDPIVGLHTDEHFIKGNKRSNFMIMSIIPCSISFFLLFTIPASSSQGLLFLQLFGLSSVLRFSLTLYIIPREAIGVQLFNGYSERNKLWAFNSFFSTVGASLSLGPSLLFFIKDWDDKIGYLAASIWVVVIYVVFSFTCSIKMKQLEIKTGSNNSFPSEIFVSNLFSQFLSLFSNRSWLMLFMGCTVFSIQFGATSGTGLYLNNFLWYFSPNDIFWGGIFSLPGSVLGALWVFKNNHLSKKSVSIKVGAVATLVGPLLICLRLIEINTGMSLLPEVGQGAFSNFWFLWCIHQLVENFLWTVFWILIASMFSDTIEDHELKSGLRMDGFVLAANNLINKIIISSGVLFSGLLLAFVGFDVAASTLEKEEAIRKLGLLLVISILIVYPVALKFISKYSISQNIHEENLKALR